MTLPSPEIGSVINYSYLWHRQEQEGMENGVKDRPCAIVAAVKKDNKKNPTVYVVPITHSKPHDPTKAVEIPVQVKSFLNLDSGRSWIICDEVNKFIWPGFDLTPTPAGKYQHGFLPPGLFKQVKLTVNTLMQQKQVRVVGRDYKTPKL